MQVSSDIPRYDTDLFSDDVIERPYQSYAEMRELGPVVFLTKTDCYAVTRFDECQRVLRNPEQFISGDGIAFNPVMNDLKGSVIVSDGERHAFMRRIEAEPLGPKALSALRSRISDEAQHLFADLLARGPTWLDAVKEISCFLPLTVVTELGGLPPLGRAKMLDWAAATFDVDGPVNSRFESALPIFQQFVTYIMRDIDRSSTAPGSWAARAFDLADKGVIPPEMVWNLLGDFIAPSLDTTITGTSNLLMLLGQNQDQWKRLKSERGRVPNAVNEALRMETPIRCFSRVAVEAVELSGVTIPAGGRIAVFYASGNRDETKFPSADRFDIGRPNASEHLAFGTGAHQCAGANLARLEMTAILNAMLDQVDTFEVGEPAYALNNLLRAPRSLPIQLFA